MIVTCRKIIAVVAVVAFVMSSGASADNQISDGSELSLGDLTISAPKLSLNSEATHVYFRSDTLETFDIEIEEKSGLSKYKEIAIAAVLVAIATYVIIELIEPDEEEEDSGTNSGKQGPDPIPCISIPIGR